MAKRQGLEILLELDGERFLMDDGTYAKFEVSECGPTPERPQGIRYSLTYHDRYNQRLIGFDNAHAPPRPKRRLYGARRSVAHDHKHLSLKDKGKAYEFDSPDQLLADFWREVDNWRKKHAGEK